MKKNSLFFLIIFIFITGNIHQSVFAQKTLIYQNPEADYRNGVDLFSKEKFGDAQQCFEKVVRQVNDPNSLLSVNAEYYAVLCSIELYNDNAEYEVLNFVSKHPENSNVNQAYFKLGNYLYNKKSYNRAIKIFQKINKDNLNNKELREYYFKSGYCYFKTEKFEQAEKAFYEIKDAQGDYAIPAKYYYGHCAYMNKNYETALKYLEKLVKDTTFGPIVPYYITQIYYVQEKYEKLLDVAIPLFKNVVTRRAPEMARMIGDAYYKLSRFQDAIPFLEMYKGSDNQFSKQDAYELGYTYYSIGDYMKAIENLNLIPVVNDSLSQNTNYLLGNAYLQTNQKKEAMNAYLLANTSFDKDIQEDALFKYAQLLYELDYNPYNEAINAFQQYIQSFPNAGRITQAHSYLVDLFLTTNNYKNALDAIEKIPEKDFRLLNAYQKITYFRGVELFNDNNFKESIELLNKSLENQYNKSIAAQAYYWKSESYYRLGDYEKAIENYKTFILSPGSFSLAFYNDAQYNMGYAYFKLKDYENTMTCFRKFISPTSSNINPKILNDAQVRLGDCYFINKEYDQAVVYYNKSIAFKGTDADYALYQKSLCLGAKGEYNPKIETLLELLKAYPKSGYIDAGLFELGNIYFAIGDNEKALKYYKELLEKYPKCSYIQKSLLQIGLIQYNTKQYDDALATLKRVTEIYPGSTASKEALYTIKNVYMQIDKVDEFVNWVKGRGNAVSSDEQDSITYMAVENKYMDGDCDNSISGFKNYLDKFPDGYFVINANFYKAECELKTGNKDEALKGYEFVADKPQSKFTENAILQAAAIYNKMENCENALPLYEKLEHVAEYKQNILTARIGEMRCNFSLKKFKETVASATNLLSTEKIPNELIQEAHLSMAKSYLAMDSLTMAQNEFRLTAAMLNNEMGAEAKYNLANIEYRIGRYNEAEKLVFELINQVPSYDYWIANGFILLSDVYLKTNNIFQAKKTLESVRDNYEGADLVLKAQEKLKAVEEIEKAEELKKLEEQKRIQDEKEKAEKEKALEEEKKQLEGTDIDKKETEQTQDNTQQPTQIIEEKK